MLINKKDNKIQKFIKVHFVGTVCVGTVCVEVLFVASIISSLIPTVSPIIISAYLPFSKLHLAGFQKYHFLQTRCSFKFLHSH